jgi:hypothetical protein
VAVTGFSQAKAADTLDEGYFTIKSITVEEVTDAASDKLATPLYATTLPGPGSRPVPGPTFHPAPAPRPTIPHPPASDHSNNNDCRGNFYRNYNGRYANDCRPGNHHGPIDDDSDDPVGDVVGAIGDVTGAIGDIVNTGKLVWQVVKENKPVVSVTNDYATAVPKGVTDWGDLETWSAPTTRVFHVIYKNFYNSTVVDFTFRLIYSYNGSIDGRGHFLTGVSIVPADLQVSWGYTFTANAKVPSITNAGTKADPIAAMQVQLQWSVDTIMKHIQNTANYYVRGDGQFQNLNE